MKQAWETKNNPNMFPAAPSTVQVMIQSQNSIQLNHNIKAVYTVR